MSDSKDKKFKSKILKLISITAGTWTCCLFDTDRSVSTECKASFETVFPTLAKQESFYLAFEPQILSYISDFLNYQTFESISDTRYVTKDEAQLKFDRVTRTCILALASLVDKKYKKNSSSSSTTTTKDENIFSDSNSSPSSLDLFLEIVSAKNFWKLTSSSNALLCRSALSSIPKISVAIPQHILQERESEIFSAFIKKPLSPDSSSSSSSKNHHSSQSGSAISRHNSIELLQALISLTHVYPSIWNYKSSKSSKKSDSKKSSKKNKDTKSDGGGDSSSSSKSPIYYLAKYIKQGNTQNNVHFWHYIMALLMELPDDCSPFKTLEPNSESQQQVEILTEAVAQSAKSAPLTPLANGPSLRTGQISSQKQELAETGTKNSGNIPVTNAADTWIFYFTFIEKIALANESSISSQLVTTAIRNFNEYIYTPENGENTNGGPLSISTVHGNLLTATVRSIAQRIALGLWPKYHDICFSELSQSLRTLTQDIKLETQSVLSKTPFINALLYSFKIYQNLSDDLIEERKAIVGEILQFVDTILDTFIESLENKEEEKEEELKEISTVAIAAASSIEALLVQIDKSTFKSVIFGSNTTVAKFKQLSTFFFTNLVMLANHLTTESTTVVEPRKQLYETLNSVVHKLFSFVKATASITGQNNKNSDIDIDIDDEDDEDDEEEDVSGESIGPINTNELVGLSISQILELPDPSSNPLSFFGPVSVFFSFYNTLIYKPLSDDIATLSRFVASNITTYLSQQLSTPGVDSKLVESSLTNAVLSHGYILTKDDAQILFNKIVETIVEIEEQSLVHGTGINDINEESTTTLKKSESESQSSAKISLKNYNRSISKLKTRLKSIVTNVRKLDADFVFSYSQSSAGKSTLTSIWRLAEIEERGSSSLPSQSYSTDESLKTTTTTTSTNTNKSADFIESLITQLDFFSLGNSSRDYNLAPEVLLTIAKDLKTEVLNCSLLDLNIPLQRACNILERRANETDNNNNSNNNIDGDLRLKVFETLLFDEENWIQVLDPIFELGISSKVCISPKLAGAYFQLDSSAQQKSLDESSLSSTFDKKFIDACLKLIAMSIYTNAFITSFSDIFIQSSSQSINATILGIEYSYAVLKVLQETHILQSLTRSKYFGVKNTVDNGNEHKTEEEREDQRIEEENQKLELAASYLDLSIAAQQDSKRAILEFSKPLKIDFKSTLSILSEGKIGAAVVATGTKKSSSDPDQDSGSKLSSPYHENLQRVWKNCVDVSSSKSFYSFLVLESLLVPVFSSSSSLFDSSTIDIRKLVPARIINKLGTLALLNTLAKTQPTVVEQSFVGLRNNIIGDLVTAPKSELYDGNKNRKYLFSLSLLVPAFYRTTTTKNNGDNIQKPCGGVAPFKIVNLISKILSVSDEFSDPDFTSFVILSGYAISTLCKTKAATTELPSSGFWEPIMEYVNEAVTSASANIGEEEEEEEGEEEYDGENEIKSIISKKLWYGHAILKTTFNVCNTLMEIRNNELLSLGVGEDDENNESLKTPEIDESLKETHTLFVDTIPLFFENINNDVRPNIDSSLLIATEEEQETAAGGGGGNNFSQKMTRISNINDESKSDTFDLSFSKEIYKYFTQSVANSSPSEQRKLFNTSKDISSFYSYLGAKRDPYFQQLALYVISTDIQNNQRDRSITLAAISSPSEEEIEEALIPVELLSLLLLPTSSSTSTSNNSSRKKQNSRTKFLPTFKLDSQQARQFLFTWYIIFQYFEQSVFSLRTLLSAQLSQNNSILNLLDFLAPYTLLLKKAKPGSSSKTSSSSSSSFDITKFETLTNLYFTKIDNDDFSDLGNEDISQKGQQQQQQEENKNNYDDEDGENKTTIAMKTLVWNILYQVLKYSGFTVKSWFNSSQGPLKNHKIKATTEQLIINFISPELIKSEIQAVRAYIDRTQAEEGTSSHSSHNHGNEDDDDDEFKGIEASEVIVLNSGKSIALLLYVSSQSMEIRFNYPDSYPLQDVRVEGVKRLAVSEQTWRSWIFFSQAAVLKHNNNNNSNTSSSSGSTGGGGGGVLAAIELFKRNATLYFEGFSECGICYSVIQDDNSLPTKECGTCHNKFHPSCLLRWFKSGNTESCPFCRTEKAFK